MPRWPLVLILVLLSLSAEASQGPDSLQALLQEHSQHDPQRVDLLLELSRKYSNGSLEECQQYALEAKALAEEISYQNGLALAHKAIGLCYNRQGKFPEALSSWQQSLDIFTTIGDREGQANLLNNIGTIYHNVGDLVKALDYYFQSLKIAEPTGNKLPSPPRSATSALRISTTP